MRVVFTAHSSKNSHLSMQICKFVFENGHIPVNLFNLYGYFMFDLIDKQKIFLANNELIKRSDELWVFGEITEGVFIEIELTKKLGKPIKYFDIITNSPFQVKEIKEDEVKINDNLNILELKKYVKKIF
ncbi:MAG: hypothetical protein QW350_04740 [Candidatus Aenigmatarchaeota archaeon]|nr:hypothetical protein [Candidatus Aenigmarchaeota archaeon]